MLHPLTPTCPEREVRQRIGASVSYAHFRILTEKSTKKPCFATVAISKVDGDVYAGVTFCVGDNFARKTGRMFALRNLCTEYQKVERANVEDVPFFIAEDLLFDLMHLNLLPRKLEKLIVETIVPLNEKAMRKDRTPKTTFIFGEPTSDVVVEAADDEVAKVNWPQALRVLETLKNIFRG